MARLHEYQDEAILAANGFKIPRGRAAASADDAVAAFKELAGDAKGREVVIKITDGNPKSRDPNPTLPKDGLAVARPKEKGEEK